MLLAVSPLRGTGGDGSARGCQTTLPRREGRRITSSLVDLLPAPSGRRAEALRTPPLSGGHVRLRVAEDQRRALWDHCSLSQAAWIADREPIGAAPPAAFA